MSTRRTEEKESLLPPPWVLSTTVFVFALWLLVQLKEIVVLLVLGYSIAYALDPILDFFERKKISRSTGILIVLAVLTLVIALLFVTAVPTLIEEYTLLTSNFSSYLNIAQQKFGSLMQWLGAILPAGLAEKMQKLSFMDVMPDLNSDALNRIFKGVSATLLQGYSLTLTLVNIALLPFFVYYIAIDFSSLYSKFVALFPSDRREKVESMLAEINVLVSAFIRGQALVACILFVLYSIGLSIVGVKLWFLLAVITGFGNLIPYIGTILGILLSSIMALVTFGDFKHVLFVWVVFGVINIIEGFLITPTIVGNKTGFSPLVIILALFAGGSLFGLLGVFLAIPVAAVLKVLLHHAHQRLLRKLGDAAA